MPNFLDDFSKYDESLEKTKDIYSGLLGLATDGLKRVQHATRNGYVYVRLRDNLSEVVLAFNDKVSPVYNFPVIIQRKNNGWIVLGRDTDRYKDWGTSAPFLPQHGDQHSFNRDGSGGGDVTWVYPDQFTPLLVYPSGTLGAGNVLVAPYLLQRTNDFIYVGNTGTQSLLVYKPTNNQAIMGLVVLDTVSGNPQLLINSGTPFSASFTGTSQVSPYIPYPSSTQEPLYAVRLVSGTTSIQWSNLYNARQFIGGGSSTTGSSSGGGISGIVSQENGVVKGTGSVLNFIGDLVDVSTSGTVTEVYITGTSSFRDFGFNIYNYLETHRRVSFDLSEVSSGTTRQLTIPDEDGTIALMEFLAIQNSYITGSVPYSLPNGKLSEDNERFHWDNVNGALWLGKKPISPLQNPQATLVVMPTGSNTPSVLGMVAFGTGTSGSPSATINRYRSRGTDLVPTPLKSGDAISSDIGVTYDGANWGNSIRLRTYADGDFITGTSTPTRFDFEVTPSGSVTRLPVVEIRSDGFNLKNTGTYNVNGIPHTHSDSGRLVQHQFYSFGSEMHTGAVVIPLDDTIPQNTEGMEVMTLGITPTNANNILRVTVCIMASHSTNAAIIGSLFRDSGASAVAVGWSYVNITGLISPLTFFYEVVAGSTSATTFKVRAGLNVAGTITINGNASARYFGGVMVTSISIDEIRV